MAKRITFTVAPELLDELLAAKPKALNLAAYCAWLVEQQVAAQQSTPASGPKRT
jgi:hypothetical protein